MPVETAGESVSARGIRRRPVWIYEAPWDLFVALCWVPIFFVWHLLLAGSGPPSDHLLQEGVTVALLVSFLHQPLTFGLVYGDANQFALHRRLFAWAPVVAVSVAIVAALENLAIVIPIAAAWNLQHTLQQRYGLQRIYAGKSGYGSPRLDRAFSYVVMAAALFAVAAMPGTARLVQRSGLDPMNARAVQLLVDVRPEALWLLALALAALVAVIGALIRQEVAAGAKANPAKWIYQISSLALVASIVVDPAAGFIAYVSAHSIEYAVVVYRTAERRYSAGQGPGVTSFLGRVGRTAAGRVAFFSAVVALALAVHSLVHGVVFNAVLYSVGALHFTFDSVIWKLRRPAVSRDFAIRAPSAARA
ncbi:MAG TPA: hypothetical protein VEH29_06565 [Acidimicrobiales bacterium]|nr:hypothetical protein [Acidimicrobiales bacterium]